MLDELQNPQWAKGGEVGQVVKDEKDIKLRIGIVSPLPYAATHGILPTQILYNVINSFPNVQAERFYLPDSDFYKIIAKRETDYVSLETKTPLKDFDVIFISIYFVPQYLNIPHILRLGEVPVWSKDRKEHHPIICIGGFPLINPEPVALFADAICIGEGEVWTEEFLKLMVEKKKRGMNKEDFLLKVAREIKGAYIPNLYDKKTRKPLYEGVPAKIQNQIVDIENRPASDIIGSIMPFHDSVNHAKGIEIARGCGSGNCRFCVLAWTRRPFRIRKKEHVIEALKQRKLIGFNSVSLSCPNATEVPYIGEVVNKCYEMDLRTDIHTERIDTFLDSQLTKVRALTKRRQLTLAPEAGNITMRNRINKPFTEEEIMAAVDKGCENKFLRIKIMFICDLPGESYSDVDSTIGLIHRVLNKRDECVKKYNLGFKPFIIASITAFNPMPFTPLEFCGVINNQNKYLYMINGLINLKGRTNKNIGDKSSRNFQWIYIGTKYVRNFQNLLQRGDKNIAYILDDLSKMGYKFEKPFKSMKNGYWEKIESYSSERGINIEKPTWKGYTKRDILPWDIVEMGVSKEYLWNQYKKFYKAEITLPCLKKCDECGVCGGDVKLCRDKIIPCEEQKKIKKIPHQERYLVKIRKDERTKYLNSNTLKMLVRHALRKVGKEPYHLMYCSDQYIRDSHKCGGEVWMNLQCDDLRKEDLTPFFDVIELSKAEGKEVLRMSHWIVTIEKTIADSLVERLFNEEYITVGKRKKIIGRETLEPINVSKSLEFISNGDGKLVFKINKLSNQKVSPHDLLAIIMETPHRKLWGTKITTIPVSLEIPEKAKSFMDY